MDLCRNDVPEGRNSMLLGSCKIAFFLSVKAFLPEGHMSEHAEDCLIADENWTNTIIRADNLFATTSFALHSLSCSHQTSIHFLSLPCVHIHELGGLAQGRKQ